MSDLYRIVRRNLTPLLYAEFHGHGFWRAVFSVSREINGSFGNAHACPSRTEIKRNLRNFK
jgi:hypothetical protein